MKDEIIFLGQIISKKGMKPDLSPINKLLKYEVQKTKKNKL